MVIVVTVALRSLGDAPGGAGDVNEARVLADAAAGNDWLLNGRNFESQHFSPLKEITDQNISKLGLAWYLDVDSTVGIVAEPIVVDGVIYVSAPLSKVYAVDAASGNCFGNLIPRCG